MGLPSSPWIECMWWSTWSLHSSWFATKKRNENKVQKGKKEGRNNEIKRSKLEIAQGFLVPLGLDVSSDQCDCHVLFELQTWKKTKFEKV